MKVVYFFIDTMVAANSNDSSVPISLRTSLDEVVKLTLSELHDLNQRKRAIGRRVRSLQHALSYMEQLISSAGWGRLSAERGFSTLPTPVISDDSERLDHIDAEVRVGARRRLQDQDYKLRRACRIAFMEVEAEIYSRIVLREAFEFAKSESAVVAVVRALDGMVEAMERLFCGWYLMPALGKDREKGNAIGFLVASGVCRVLVERRNRPSQ